MEKGENLCPPHPFEELEIKQQIKLRKSIQK
jgi:hypothetical protein